MRNLPKDFQDRMNERLPAEEREAFFAAYEEPPVKGVRVNTLKISPEEYLKISPFPLEQTTWAKDGFYTNAEKLGAHPHHFAGLLYSQEPSAMSVAPKLEAKEGEFILDLCSAPGGKGTQLAAAMRGKGVIVLNEPIFSRAQILSSNVERTGVRNAVVLNEYPETLAAVFTDCFDKILVDAPCSGEGMFRKNEKEAIEEWSAENVALCAKRQKNILDCAAKMLKKGGRLVYSTCTFSEEEDEWQVRDFLETHADFCLIEQKKTLPHRVRGEGHFFAVFEKTEGREETLPSLKTRISPQSEKAYREFEKEFFFKPFASNLFENGGTLYELPSGVFDWKKLHVLRAGVRLGEVKNGRFEPCHSLAACLKKGECKNVADFSCDDIRLRKFLSGETIEDERMKDGWGVICADGYPAGLGKAVRGTIKNHIPKGLRTIKR